MGTKIVDGVAYETYVVQKGDYLIKIANKFGLSSYHELIEMNKSTQYYKQMNANPDLIYPGWELLVRKVDLGNGAGAAVTHTHVPCNLKGTINGAYECTVWQSHDPKSAAVTKLSEGTSITCTEQCPTNGTVFVGNGWISELCVDWDSVEVTNEVDNTDAVNELKRDIQNMGKVSTSTSIIDLLIDNATGIHGMPYQFMDDVDGRLYSNVVFGRKYIERIVTKMPLLLMTPGAPNFMPDFNPQEKKSVLAALISLILGKKSEITDNLEYMLSGKNRRYYTFKFEYAEYYKYVNAMLRYCAVALNIGNIKHSTSSTDKDKTRFNSYDWSQAVNSKLRGFINSQEYVAFYIDSETSISESFSSSTTSSSLADTINSAASQSKEIQFLLGTGAEIDTGIFGSADPAQETAYQDAISSITSIGNDYFRGNRLLTNINEAFETIGRGGKLIFPEIWDSSDFTKSYDISQKLRTPDGDKISWYLNIMVPLAHWICMAAPRGMKDSVNAMLSPFLVRGYYKGIFNVDTGIITNLSINKGREAAWTVDGLPTEVDINVTIKDLYGQIAISPTNSGTFGIDYTFFRNTALVDYLCNTCGVNVNKQEVSRLIETYILWFKNGLHDAYGNIWLKINQDFSNFASSVYGKILFK